MKFTEILQKLLENKKNNKIRRKCWNPSDYYEYHSVYGLRYQNSCAFPGGDSLSAGDWEFYDERVELQTLKPGDEFTFLPESPRGRVVSVITSIGRQTTCDTDQIFYLDLNTNTVTYACKTTKVYRIAS